jgi:hypothetical protein
VFILPCIVRDAKQGRIELKNLLIVREFPDVFLTRCISERVTRVAYRERD